MKSINGQLSIHTGETFTIDYTFINRDGSPYILSKGLTNPYFLITIASNRYKQDSNYLLNYWSKIDFLPLFTNTNCIDITSINSSNTDWDIIPLPAGYDTVGSYLQNGVRVYFADKAVFYLEDENGNTTYKYFVYDSDPTVSSDYSGSWVDYNIRLVKNFTQQVTKQWINGTYYYSITVVSGTPMLTYLQQLCFANDIEYTDDNTAQELYDLLIESGYTFDSDFNISRPIYDYDAVYPLLSPEALMVLPSLNGDI